MSARAIAAHYAARGWPIFPVQPRGKEPLTLIGFKAATTDAAQVGKWWETWPDANVACVPGQTGHVVIDIDGPEGEAAARGLGLLSEPTLIVTTARGRHLWFTHPGGTIANVVLAPHLDVRADHGYVLLPPSVHPSGAVYRWVGHLGDVKPLPPDVVALFNGQHQRSSAAPLPERIPAGQRNALLTSLAGSMRRRGASAAAIQAALEEENRRCSPPLDSAELAAIAASVARYAPATPVHRGEHNGAVTDGRAPLSDRSDDGLTHIRELLTEPEDVVSWIVDGLLPAGGLSVLAGKPKAGKSTTARALALRVSRGESFLGRPTTAGPVIYLGLEDPRRVTRGHLTSLGARETDNLWVFTGTRPEKALLWLEGVLAHVEPVLLVADTLQHLLGVTNLNDYAEVVTALSPVLHLVRSRRTHALLVHHAGKGERVGFDAVLGSTAIVGTADVVLLERRREDKVRTLTTLQRVGEDLPETVLVLNDRQEPTLGASLREYDAAQLGERIITWLADHPDATEQAIIEAVEGGSAPLGRALRELLQQEKVTREGKGQRGDPYRYSPPRPAPKGLGENPDHTESPAMAGPKVPHAPSGGPGGEQGDLSEPDPEGLFDPDVDPDEAARAALGEGA